MQGPIGHREEDFESNVIATRNLFPDSEFILSTWEGSHVGKSEELFDHVVFLTDPGPSFVEPVTRTINNIYRQSVSTFAGLKIASKEYAVKLRSDFSILSLSFVNEYCKSIEYKTSYIFSQPILTLFSGSRDPFKSGSLFCPSDMFHFGLTKDLIRYWNFKLPEKEAMTLDIWEKFLLPRRGPLFMRYTTEQYLFIEFLKKNSEPNYLNGICNYSFECIFRSHDLLSDNFIFVNHYEHGISGPSSLLNNPAQFKDCYSRAGLLELKNLSLLGKRKLYYVSMIKNYIYFFSLIGIKSYIACLLRLLNLDKKFLENIIK